MIENHIYLCLSIAVHVVHCPLLGSLNLPCIFWGLDKEVQGTKGLPQLRQSGKTFEKKNEKEANSPLFGSG